MALNPVAYTEKVVGSFLRYQLTAYPFADASLYAQMRALLSLDVTRNTPLFKGPYVSLSRAFLSGTTCPTIHRTYASIIGRNPGTTNTNGVHLRRFPQIETSENAPEIVGEG